MIETDIAVGEAHRATLWTMRHNNRRLTAEVVRIDGHWELRLQELIERKPKAPYTNRNVTDALCVGSLAFERA